MKLVFNKIFLALSFLFILLLILWAFSLRPSKKVIIQFSGHESVEFKEALQALEDRLNQKSFLSVNRPIDFYHANFFERDIPLVKNKNHLNLLWLGSQPYINAERLKTFDYIFASTSDLKAFLDTLGAANSYLPIFIKDKKYAPSSCALHPLNKNDCSWVIIGDMPTFEKELNARGYAYLHYNRADEKTAQSLYQQTDKISGIAVGNAFLNDKSLDLSPFFIIMARHHIPLVAKTPAGEKNHSESYPITIFNDHILYWLHHDDIRSIFDELSPQTGDAAARFAQDYFTEEMAALRIKSALENSPFNIPLQKDKITFNVYAAMSDITIGDYAVAKDLKKSFQRLGYFPEVIFPASIFKETGIANIFFRGAAPLLENKKELNSVFILWLLYPFYEPEENIDSEKDYLNKMMSELQNADVVASASLKLYKLMQENNIPSFYIPQFTNTQKFYPHENPYYRSEVLFVGTNTWYRKSANILLKHHLPIAIYGPKWADGVAIKDYIPNNELGQYYSSAKIVLNDSRPDMLQLGFISNRIFDATACQTLVISDYMPEIEEIYGDSVPMWKTEDELVELVTYYLNPEHEAERQEKARRAYEITIQNFTSDIAAQKFKQLIDDVKKMKGLP